MDCIKNYQLIFHKGMNRNILPFNDTGMSVCDKWLLRGYYFKKMWEEGYP